MSYIKGYVAKFGENIDTDQIYPGRYLELTDPKEIAKHAMEGADPSFSSKAKRPVIIVAGKNFGCGSSREHAVITLINAGVKAVIASSFGRIFYRNAINLGLPVVISLDVNEKVKEGDDLEVRLEEGLLVKEGNVEIKAQKIPPNVRGILEKGGLIPYLRSQVKI